MATVGKSYYCAVFVCLYASALLAETVMASEDQVHNKRLEKRSISFDDWKRAGQAGYMNDLENALGAMQRPRFGKRAFTRDDALEDYLFYNDKRGNALTDLENALGSMQRPRFGRRR